MRKLFNLIGALLMVVALFIPFAELPNAWVQLFLFIMYMGTGFITWYITKNN